MLSGCERGSGNDRAQAGVGFGKFGASILMSGVVESVILHNLLNK